MDTFLNIKTFLTTVRLGSFSAAARQMDTVPSVITKRVSRLEDQIGAKLFARSTRGLKLTESGERHYPRLLSVAGEIDDIFHHPIRERRKIEGSLRIKCPTTLTVLHFGRIVSAFKVKHPNVRIELVLVDRSVNPMEEGYDVAIGALPASYANVTDIPLCLYPRMLVASTAYLDKHGVPDHPRDLTAHDCLTFLPTGSTWTFQSETGLVSINVHSTFSANDSQVLRDAALSGLGITMIAQHIAAGAMAEGKLVEIHPQYRVPDLWIKALVPENRMDHAAVRAFIAWLKEATQPTAPWERIETQPLRTLAAVAEPAE